jgi:hypothetical protein
MAYMKYMKCQLGQFNLIDRLSFPPAPQKLARPNFLKFSINYFFPKIWCPTPVFIFQILFWVKKPQENMLGALNDTLFVDKNKVINRFSLGK